MKKIYNLKTLLIMSYFVGTIGFSQNLPDVLCNLNADYANVTALVPAMYTFAYDGVNNIGDGGNDMYDGGNMLNTNLMANIPYSNDVIAASAGFGTGGEYFTRHLPGLFVMVADLDGVASFALSGNNGADGGGIANDYVFSTTVNAVNYNVFVKRVYGTSDPSINQVIIVPENLAATHTWAVNTDNTQHQVDGLATSTRVYYFLVASTSGGLIDNTTITSITDEFLLVAVGSGVQANASGTNICDGDMLTLTGSGGTIYTWDNGVTDGVPFSPALGAVNYTVSSTALNGCVQTAMIGVTVNALPVVTGTPATQSVCLGEDATLSGSGALTYTWDNGVTDAVAFATSVVGLTTYTVTGTDVNGCEANATADITAIALPAVTANADQISYCDGDMVTLTGSGTDSYSWDNGVTDGVAFSQAVGTIAYEVTGTDGITLCENTDIIMVTVNANPSISLTAWDELFGNDGGIALSINSGNAPFTFDWDNDGTGDNDDNNDLSGVAGGTYNVTMTDGNGCIVTDGATVDTQLSLTESSLSMTVYPNPATKNISITLEGSFNYSIADMSGRVISSGNGNGQELISLETLANGSYLLTVQSGDKTQTIQVIKQ